METEWIIVETHTVEIAKQTPVIWTFPFFALADVTVGVMLFMGRFHIHILCVHAAVGLLF